MDPSIWSSANPIIYCIPPCIYILPPWTLSTTTTITLPLLTTSLEVAWQTSEVTTLQNGEISTSTGYEQVTEFTTLTIPPVTTNQINLWNVNITSGGLSSSLIYITSSILPPPFTISDDQNPQSQQGVTHLSVTRTITPLPYPYATTSPGPQDHPPLTHVSGHSRHPCKIGCGHKCRGFFCHVPCLLDCISPPPGFHDPVDPDDSNPPGPGPGPGPSPPNSPEPSPTSTSCSASTVTDFWVSCSSINSDSTSCTTTSSSLVRGCNIAAATDITTVAGSCAAYDPDDFSGENGSDDAPASGTTASPPSYSDPVPNPEPSCYLQNQDPDRGINTAYCVCDSSLYFPELPSTRICAYKSLPLQTINPTPSLTVVTGNCQVCTKLDINEAACTPVPNCIPTPMPAPTPNLIPTPTPTPTPPGPTHTFQIGYMNSCAGTYSPCEKYWTFFTESHGMAFHPCADEPVYSDKMPFKDGPTYPISKGPFNGGGLVDCMYKQQSSLDMGTITCDGAILGSCVENTDGSQGCCGGDSIWSGSIWESKAPRTFE